MRHARTLNEYAKIAFPRDKTVCIFEAAKIPSTLRGVRSENVMSSSIIQWVRDTRLFYRCLAREKTHYLRGPWGLCEIWINTGMLCQ